MASRYTVKNKEKTLFTHLLYVMLKFRFSYFIILTICFLFGCYSHSQMPSLAPTKGKVKKWIYIHTNTGKVLELVSYEITEDKILGQDKFGNNHELKLKNIKMLIQKKLTKTGRTIKVITISTFIASAIFIVYFYFGMKGFSDLK